MNLELGKGVGLLLGAGASFGSQQSCCPPLGSGLYASIKTKNIGARRVILKEPHECTSAVDYLSPSNSKITEVISTEDWVGAISQASKTLFEEGKFERAMALLRETIADARSQRRQVKGNSFMFPGDDQLDIGLPEKIMRLVAECLYAFRPSADNLYRQVLTALPDGACIFSLNYDSLIELVATDQRVNLIEHEVVQKSYLSHPSKSLTYIQLHGGVTLCSTWDHDRPGVPDLISHSEVERISRSFCVSRNLRFDLDDLAYCDSLRGLAAMSFYNPEKSNVIAPDVFDAFHKRYSDLVTTRLSKLIVIGCNYNPHDDHLWKAVEQFQGDLYWCGEMPQGAVFADRVINIGPRFQSSIASILQIVEGAR